MPQSEAAANPWHQEEERKDKIEPTRDKTKVSVRPVWSESSLSAWRKLGPLATHWVHSEDWSDWADTQADLSLRWAHSHIVGFVTRRPVINACKIREAHRPVVFSQSEVITMLKGLKKHEDKEQGKTK